MECDRQNFLSTWTLFCPSMTYPTEKSKFLQKLKKCLEILTFYRNVYHKWQSYDLWFLRYGARWTEFFFILDCLLPFYLSNNPKNQNFEKSEKNTWRCHHFTHVPKIMITWCTVAKIWCTTDGWTDGQTDGQKKWHIEVGAPPKNNKIK